MEPAEQLPVVLFVNGVGIIGVDGLSVVVFDSNYFRRWSRSGRSDQHFGRRHERDRIGCSCDSLSSRRPSRRSVDHCRADFFGHLWRLLNRCRRILAQNDLTVRHFKSWEKLVTKLDLSTEKIKKA